MTKQKKLLDTSQKIKEEPRKAHDILVSYDNGTSGSIAILASSVPVFWAATPIKKCKNYQKVEKHLNRVDTIKLFDLMYDHVYAPTLAGFTALVLLERPYCNPMGFNSSLLAARALEAELVIIELLGLPYIFVDSKEWQSEMLPKGIVGRDELKKASFEVGKKLFPGVKFKKDADSLLMAEWARRKGM